MSRQIPIPPHNRKVIEPKELLKCQISVWNGRTLEAESVVLLIIRINEVALEKTVKDWSFKSIALFIPSKKSIIHAQCMKRNRGNRSFYEKSSFYPPNYNPSPYTCKIKLRNLKIYACPSWDKRRPNFVGLRQPKNIVP